MHSEDWLLAKAEAALADGRWHECGELAQRVLDSGSGVEERALARCFLAFSADRSGTAPEVLVEERYENAVIDTKAAFGTHSTVLRRLELQRALFLSTRDLPRSLAIAKQWVPEQLAELTPRERASWARNLVGFSFEAGQYDEAVELAELVLGQVKLSDGARRFILAAKAAALIQLGRPKEARSTILQAPPPLVGFAARVLADLDALDRGAK